MPKNIHMLTMFPECQNIHLIKDVGMLPYALYHEYGYDVAIASFQTGFEYLDNLVRGLRIEQIKRVFHNDRLNTCLFLWNKATKYDVLQLYHVDRPDNILWTLIYKLRNKHGVVYVKMDADRQILNRFNYWRKGIKGKIYRYYLGKCNLITTEVTQTIPVLEKAWDLPIQYVPNGFYSIKQDRVEYKNKKDVITTVGRIGAHEKNNEELLEAFALIADDYPNWKLQLVGPIASPFNQYIDSYFEKHSELRSRVIFTGEITNRDELTRIYSESKIFVLTSVYESFGIVCLEAMASGCYIVTSKVGAYLDVTNCGKYGTWYEGGSIKDLSLKLSNCCSNEKLLLGVCKEAQQYVYERFNWFCIASQINKMITEAIEKERGVK